VPYKLQKSKNFFKTIVIKKEKTCFEITFPNGEPEDGFLFIGNFTEPRFAVFVVFPIKR
jgi:hypothetical protein